LNEDVCIVCGTKINTYKVYGVDKKWRDVKEVCLTCKQRKDDERKFSKVFKDNSSP
tara:strand:+ start:1116 stop:1283 length:168 start_codon:yes stop_codon:yes gene_type:complete